jgi:hypothetical protein
LSREKVAKWLSDARVYGSCDVTTHHYLLADEINKKGRWYRIKEKRKEKNKREKLISYKMTQ